MDSPFQITPEVFAQLSASEQAEIAAALQEADAAVKANPLLTYNNPFFCGDKIHRKQLLFHAAREPIRAYFGGNRAGKTTSGLIDDIIQAIDPEVVPKHLRAFKHFDPPFECRIVAPDFKRTMNRVILKKIRTWVPPGQLVGNSWEKAFSKDDYELHFKNGSSFQFMSYEQDVDKFGGADLDRVHYDEEPPWDIRQECLMRLLDRDGDELFSMTPLNGFTWMKTEIHEKRHHPGYFVIEVDMDDNPWLSERAKKRILAGMTPEEVEARKKGRFVHFAGLVYGKYWNEDAVVAPLDPPSVAGQDIVVGIDPGVNTTGLVWAAFDNDNCGIVFDSVKLHNQLVDQVCDEIRARNTLWGIDPDYYVIDPSARNRTQIRSASSGSVNAETIESEFARCGIFTVHGQNDVDAGVLQVKRRLHHGQLYVAANNLELINEFDNYRIDPKAKNKFAVIKENDHLLDAMRYVVMSRPYIGDVELKKRGFAPRDDFSHLFQRRGAKSREPHPLGSMV